MENRAPPRGRQRRDADAAAYEQRPLDVEVEPVPERAEHVQFVAALERAERTRARPDRIDQEASSPAAAKQRLIGLGSTRPAPRA